MTDTKWQRALLPFMQLVIVLLAAFYLIISYLQFTYFTNRVEKPRSANITAFLGSIGYNNMDNNNLSLEEKQWIAQCFFEAYTVDTRQQNAEFLMVSRTWIKYLGFMTGMVLAIVGAVFILGKLKDGQPNILSGERDSVKISLQSHSPGIVMAVLGTALILTTIFTHQSIEKTDGAVYLPVNEKTRWILNGRPIILDSAEYNQVPDSTAARPPGF